jgi:hypothetical protein
MEDKNKPADFFITNVCFGKSYKEKRTELGYKKVGRLIFAGFFSV